MAQLLQFGVNGAYKKYIVFLKQNPPGNGNMCNLERRKMRALIRHACYWKGGQAAPRKEYIVRVLRLKGQVVSDSDTKFEVYQQLLTYLLSNLRGKDAHTEPIPRTPVAKLLFNPPDNVIHVPATSVNKNVPPPVVGTRRFPSVDEFNRFMVLGQHPTNASPCIPAAKVDWTHPMVYEEE